MICFQGFKFLEHIPVRLYVGLMLFIGAFTTFMLNVNMSINIISMVKPITSELDSNDTTLIGHIEDNLINHGPRYSWTIFEQSLILGAHSYGTLLPNLFGGVLAEKFGARNVIVVTFFLSAVMTCLVPLVASDNYVPIFVIRLLIGFVGGFYYPAGHHVISKWSPPDEKGKFVSSLMGSLLGTVVTWPIAGLIIENWGWQYAFYTPAIFTFITATLWMLITNTPQTHPRISTKELEYIVKSQGDSISKHRAWPRVGLVLRSMPFWALVASHFGNCWGFYFMLTLAPKFMTEALGFSLATAGLLASAPILGRLILGFVFAIIGDNIRRKNLLSVTFTRKSFLSLSHIIPGVLLIVICFITEGNTVVILTTMIVAFSLNGCIMISLTPNFHDIAPNYAGVTYGCINFFGVSSGFLAPIAAAHYTQYSSTFNEWTNLFIITGAIYIVTAILFIIFGSGEVQKWNNVMPKSKIVG